MIFNYQYLPKISEEDRARYNGLNKYVIPNVSEYAIPETSYFPSLDYSISKKDNFSNSGSDIADTITNDKIKFLGTTANHLKSQIEERSRLRDNHVKDLDSMISECGTGVMNLESWPMFSNQMVEKKRADFKNSVQRLELEKKKEILNCWKDQSSLYKELLETLGEYKNVQRRSKMLSGGD